MADLKDCPRFPPELEREIFELLALDNIDTEAKNLLVVSKRVHDWIEPLIYRVLFCYRFPKRSGPPPIPALKEFCVTHQITPRITKLCSYGRKVLLHGMAVDDVAKLLPLCTKAKEIALWMLDPSLNLDYHYLQPFLPKSAPTLSINVSYLFTKGMFKFTPSVLQHITHLDVIALNEDFWKVEWKNFGLLTKLSHLAIDPPAEHRDPIVKGILGDVTAFKALQILLVIITESISSEELESPPPSVYADDPRFVRMAALAFPIEHWISGARSGRGLWYVAERLKQGLMAPGDLEKEVPYF